MPEMGEIMCCRASPNCGNFACFLNFFGFFSILMGGIITFMGFTQTFPDHFYLPLIGPTLLGSGALLLCGGSFVWLCYKRESSREARTVLALNNIMEQQVAFWMGHYPDCAIFSQNYPHSQPDRNSGEGNCRHEANTTTVEAKDPILNASPDDLVWLQSFPPTKNRSSPKLCWTRENLLPNSATVIKKTASFHQMKYADQPIIDLTKSKTYTFRKADSKTMSHISILHSPDCKELVSF